MGSVLNRELSWLSFNARVLQEAMDPTVPLVERMRFLGIYSSNMDEFFRVRVANVRRMKAFSTEKIEGFKGTPAQLLETIQQVVMDQQKSFEWAYKKILVDFGKHNVFHITEKDLNPAQEIELRQFYEDKLRHVIVPLILEKKTPFPRLRDYQIYLAVKMKYTTANKVRYALVQIPTQYPRFYQLKDGDKHQVIMMDDIIRLNLKSIFSIFNFEEIEAYTFKFTRDAELNLDDDLSENFIEKIEKSVKLRKKGDPVRFVYDQKMPSDMLDYLLQGLSVKKGMNTLPGGKYHNFKDFTKFPDFGNKEFVYPKMPPLKHAYLEGKRSIFKAILEKDVLLHFPYHRFTYVVDLLSEAAIDPKVLSIKINVYRVAEHSQIMNALMNAVSNGKNVTVIFELQARFDEENNLYWSNRLKENGANVFYGLPHRKIHSKLLQIKRETAGKIQTVSYIGTGNFNEETSKFYGDLALLTSDKHIAHEVEKVFELIESGNERVHFHKLLVSPFNIRRKLLSLIDEEIRLAKEGKKAFIRLKVNNLVDSQMIDKLYKASHAGVKIEMIVRGICTLIPNEPGRSENIKVVSLIDRYLEHTRFMIFGNAGKPLYFISSADWMARNLNNRIEVTVPILDEQLKKEIDLIFDYQWKGNVKVRILDKEMRNRYVRKDGKLPFRAQFELYQYYKGLEKQITQ
ncbi:MAG: polyphosphate kinase 1 [Crocinitomicaceae bacterium]